MENNPKELPCPSLSLDQPRALITIAVMSYATQYCIVLYCILSCDIFSIMALLAPFSILNPLTVLEIAGRLVEWSCQKSGDPSRGLILTPTQTWADVPTWPWPVPIPMEVPDGRGQGCQKGSKD